jgi:hypothetical protein
MLATKIEDSARGLIAKHEDRAVFVAVDLLNESIDQRDWHARNFWAQVVHTRYTIVGVRTNWRRVSRAVSSATKIAVAGLRLLRRP